jgi:hypothetical protein
MNADLFERFFSHTLRDEAELRRLLSSVPEASWPRFRADALAHIHAELHRPGLPAGASGDLEYGTLHVVTPIMARRHAPLRLRRRLLTDEEQRRQQRKSTSVSQTGKT